MVFDVDPEGGSYLYTAWIVTGAVGLASLLAWLAAEFVTGSLERGIWSAMVSADVRKLMWMRDTD